MEQRDFPGLDILRFWAYSTWHSKALLRNNFRNFETGHTGIVFINSGHGDHIIHPLSDVVDIAAIGLGHAGCQLDDLTIKGRWSFFEWKLSVNRVPGLVVVTMRCFNNIENTELQK